jgi:hypothetical protein
MLTIMAFRCCHALAQDCQGGKASCGPGSISGRVSLPAGVAVEGTSVIASGPSGEGEGFADQDGYYVIEWLPPGEYVVGVNRVGIVPRLDAPFLATYAPGVTDPNAATKFVVVAGSRVTDADVSVPKSLPIRRLRVHATYNDGRLAARQVLWITYGGYGEMGAGEVDQNGIAEFGVVEGDDLYLVANDHEWFTGARCITPVAVGPGNHADLIEVVFSVDGCREQANLTSRALLRGSAMSELTLVNVIVTLLDGSSVQGASVTIQSKRDPWFVAVFNADKDGRLDLPIPKGREFEVYAVVDSRDTCKSHSLLFNTDESVRWRDPGAGVTPWHDASGANATVHLSVSGPSCPAAAH